MRVLIVDDDEASSELMAIICRRVGLEPLAEANGLAALARLAREPVDLVVMDLWLPHLDGIEAVRRLRQMPGGETLPVVFVTAEAQPAKLSRCQEVGAREILVKPYSPRQAMAALERAMKPTS